MLLVVSGLLATEISYIVATTNYAHAQSQQLASNNSNPGTGAVMTNSDDKNMTTNTSPIRTFHAEGTINSYVSDLLIGNQSIGLGILDKDAPARIYVLGGDWNLDVINGTIKNFTTNIVMVTFDGNNLHTHTIPNLRNFSAPVPGVYPVALTGEHDLRFSGVVDIYTDGAFGNVSDWNQVPITVTIYNGKTIGILADPSRIAHFNALPIYGIVRSLTDDDNRDLRSKEIVSFVKGS